ncbi:MAG: hypothetical protein ABI035_10340 [Gemmatimonadaceae bacterium]
MRRWAVATVAAMLSVAGSSDVAHAQQSRGQEQQGKQLPRQTTVPVAEQHTRAQQQKVQVTQYKQHLGKQLPVIQHQTAQLATQKRTAQYRVQQQYAAKLREQETHLQTTRNFATDPYVRTPANYRYVISGTTRETNQYGAAMLREAVNDGYKQGYLAGQADRSDRWKADYQDSPAYIDANYGYTGNYVPQGDYNYYFREGFQRGYGDAYNGRLQYGQDSGTNYSILSSVLTGILGLSPIG